MDVLVLIDKLDALVRNAKQVPLRSEVRVHKEELSDLLNELRETIPEELKEARWIVKEREEMLAAASGSRTDPRGGTRAPDPARRRA